MVPDHLSRWVVGFVAAGVLVLMSLASFRANLDARAEARYDGRDVAAYRTYTARATATVVDVAPHPVVSGLLTTVVTFTPARGEPVTTRLTLPDGYPAPEAGDPVEVAYDPERPERAADGGEVLRLAEQAGGLDRITAAEAEPAGYLPALVTALLALLVMAATVVWATGGSWRAGARAARVG